MAINAEILARVLYKTATTLQHYNFVDFARLKMLTVLLYLLKYKFHYSENWVFVAVYRIQKLKTKTCFSQTSKVKASFQAKNCN